MQTAKDCPSGPASEFWKPQLLQVAGARRAISVLGPNSLEFHRSPACSRPTTESTRARPSPNSQPDIMPRYSSTYSKSSLTSVPKNSANPAVSLSSFAFTGKTSPALRSPGCSRSLQGTHGGARSESGPGSSTTSVTVTVDLLLGVVANVTAHCQPR